MTATEAPAGTETLPVKWIRVSVPDLGVMRAAVARPSGTGSFPAVLVLHGTHGFARQSVEWASDLARAGFIAVAACWFSGGGGAAVNEVTPIPCPEIPPLGAGDYMEAVQVVDALVKATRGISGVRADRIAIVGLPRRRSDAAVSAGGWERPGRRSSLFGLRAQTLEPRRRVRPADPDHARHGG